MGLHNLLVIGAFVVIVAALGIRQILLRRHPERVSYRDLKKRRFK